MSLTQVSDHSVADIDDHISTRHRVVARTLNSRLTGTAIALAFTSAMLAGVALSAKDIQASTEVAKERVWQSVSTIVCGSYLNAVTRVGPGCGTTAP